MSRIMLVDDEANILKALRRVLGATPCACGGTVFRLQIETFTEPEAALARAAQVPFELVLSDYRMPGMDGVAFLSAFKGLQPDAVRLILSGYADLNALVGAINQAQIYRFLSKPWNDYELVSTVAQALAYRQLTLENQRLADQTRLAQGTMSAAEWELKRLEQESPGITQVNWGPDGSVILDPDLLDKP